MQSKLFKNQYLITYTYAYKLMQCKFSRVKRTLSLMAWLLGVVRTNNNNNNF